MLEGFRARRAFYFVDEAVSLVRATGSSETCGKHWGLVSGLKKAVRTLSPQATRCGDQPYSNLASPIVTFTTQSNLAVTLSTRRLHCNGNQAKDRMASGAGVSIWPVQARPGRRSRSGSCDPRFRVQGSSPSFAVRITCPELCYHVHPNPGVPSNLQRTEKFLTGES